MGGRSSNGSRNNLTNNYSSNVSAFRQVNSKTVSDWISTQTAAEYLDVSPESINVGGVNFTWIGGTKTDYGDRYINTYQATEQASNGEYPVIEVVVLKQRVRGGGYKWKFDTSTFGTGLR